MADTTLFAHVIIKTVDGGKHDHKYPMTDAIGENHEWSLAAPNSGVKSSADLSAPLFIVANPLTVYSRSQSAWTAFEFGNPLNDKLHKTTERILGFRTNDHSQS